MTETAGEFPDTDLVNLAIHFVTSVDAAREVRQRPNGPLHKLEASLTGDLSDTPTAIHVKATKARLAFTEAYNLRFLGEQEGLLNPGKALDVAQAIIELANPDLSEQF